MNTLFLNKNFMKMEKGELAHTYVHFDKAQVTSRSFEAIIGRPSQNLREIKILEDLLDELYDGDDELEPPFSWVLSLEYGKDLVIVDRLPKDALNYVLNTPESVIRMDLWHVIEAIRMAFERRL